MLHFNENLNKESMNYKYNKTYLIIQTLQYEFL